MFMSRRRAPIWGAVALLALVVVAAVGAAGSSPPPAPVALAAGTYGQDFDTLASTGTSNVLPPGWMLSEAGTGAAANGSYSAGTGSGTAGDTYIFGTAAGERALGMLQSGTVIPTIGAAFTNSTGGTI